MPTQFLCAFEEGDDVTVHPSSPMVRIEATSRTMDAYHSTLLAPSESYALAAYVEWLSDDSDREEPSVDLPDHVAPVLVVDENGETEQSLWVHIRVSSEEDPHEPIEIVFDLTAAQHLSATLYAAAATAVLGFTDPEDADALV